MKILVVKLADLGDLLLSEPAIRSLRYAFPDAQIDVLTTPHAAQLLPHFGHQTNPITFEKSAFDAPGASAMMSAQKAGRLAARLRREQYDRIVILHHLTTGWGAKKYRALALSAGAPLVAGLDNGRGGFLTHPVIDRGFGYKHESEYMLDVAVAAGGATVPAIPRFEIDRCDLPFHLPRSFVAIAPAAGEFANARVWPAQRFVKLSAMLVSAGHDVVVVGGQDAKPAAEEIANCIGPGGTISLAGCTTLNQLAAVLRRASALIGNDSFPAHLAAAVNTPVLAIFGPSNVGAWAPRSDRAITLTAGLPCSPCLYTGYRLGRREGCPSRTCLTEITPSIAFEKTQELLSA